MNIIDIDITRDPVYKNILPLSYSAVSLEGLNMLVNLARIHKAKRIFEFGTWFGFTAVELCKHTEAVVYTIDWQIYAHPVGEERIIKIIADSTKFDFSPYKEYFDMAFVDGGHSYDVVKSDTESGLAILKKNGIIVWHDYVPDANLENYDVAKYIDAEILPKYQLYRTASNIIFAKKNELSG